MKRRMDAIVRSPLRTVTIGQRRKRSDEAGHLTGGYLDEKGRDPHHRAPRPLVSTPVTIVQARGGHLLCVRQSQRKGRLTPSRETPWHRGTQSAGRQLAYLLALQIAGAGVDDPSASNNGAHVMFFR